MKQKPVVVYIITKLELGGAQKVCLTLFNELKKNGIKTILISGADGYFHDQVHNHPDFIPIPSFQREISFFADIKTFFFLIKTLRNLYQQHPQLIVHTHSSKAGILGRWAAWIARIPRRIHTIHGYGFHDFQPWYIWWPLYLIELATSLITTQFICVSSADIKKGIALFPFFTQKHRLIRAAVDTNAFVPATKTNLEPSNPFIFGTVACFKPQKNLFDLLQAFAVVHQQLPSVKLEIIGDGQLRGAIEAWIAQRNLEKSIILHGWQDTIAPIMRRWNCFVLTSLWEGLPCAIVEARLLKLPVITYDVGGIHDVITNERNGYLVQPKKWRSVAERMVRIALSNYTYTQLRTTNDDLSDFTLQTMVQEHQRLYER